MFTKETDNKVTKEMTTLVGRPDELINSEIGPNGLLEETGIGHPTEVFVHAGDLARLTGCSLDTGRNWLDRFEQRGLVKRHGDGSAHVDGEARTVRLYRPVLNDTDDVMKTLHEMDGQTPPESVAATKKVTPGQFEYIGGSECRFIGDEDVIVDVEKPNNGASLQDHVHDQLRPYGLVPSSPKNFVYDLRKEAGLI